MKRLFTLFFGLGTLSVLTLSHSSGVFTADYTGSAGQSTQHCAQAGCHSSGGYSGDGTISIKVMDGAASVWSYTPGTTYTIEVTRPSAAYTKVGMQSGAMLFSTSNPTGTIANNITPTHMQLNTVPGGNMISHTVLGSTAAISGGLATWKYSWTAPATAVGAIDIYALMNLTNNDGTDNGDSVVRTILTLSQPWGVSDVAKNAFNLTLSPNPAQNFLTFTADQHLMRQANVEIYSLSGKLVLKSSNINDLGQFQLDISSLPSTLYYCLVQNAVEKAGQVFIKQ